MDRNGCQNLRTCFPSEKKLLQLWATRNFNNPLLNVQCWQCVWVPQLVDVTCSLMKISICSLMGVNRQ